jgi:Hint domain
MKRSHILAVLIGSLLLASCATASPPVAAGPTPTVELTKAAAPTQAPPTSIPPEQASLSPTELKYRLLEQYPNFFFCDPDTYPVAHGDELTLAQQSFADLQANTEEFQAILSHNGLSSATSFTDEQKLLIYRDHKKLAAISLEATGDVFHFQLQTADGQQGLLIKGLIDSGGQITVQERTPTMATCPICLAAWTFIDTPSGKTRVTDLRVGDMVWTVNAEGQRVAQPVLEVSSTQVPSTHEMVHVVLSDGRELWASPGHPTTDGRRLADLNTGDALDGAVVTVAERVPYGQPATYDLLPAGSTGWYWANGILLGSTLARGSAP